jgi:hypothetical protein
VSEFSMRVSNARQGVGKALMFFDVDFGYTDDTTFVGMMTIKGFVYKYSNEGKPYFQGPSKLRTKNGVAVKNERGFDQYDEFAVLYAEKGGNPKEPEKWGVTEGGWAARKIILDQAQQAYAKLSRATAERVPAATTEYAAGVGSKERSSPVAAQNTDDDLPF